MHKSKDGSVILCRIFFNVCKSSFQINLKSAFLCIEIVLASQKPFCCKTKGWWFSGWMMSSFFGSSSMFSKTMNSYWRSNRANPRECVCACDSGGTVLELLSIYTQTNYDMCTTINMKERNFSSLIFLQW